MQKSYLVKETVNHFHTIIIDEELNINDIVKWAKNNNKLYDTGYEAIYDLLNKYKEKYGFDFEVKPNDCGTEIVDMEVIEEM